MTIRIKQKVGQLLSTFLLQVVFALLTAQSSPAESMGWVLEQKSNYLGSQICYVSPTGLKIRTRIISTIVLGPSKRVIIFNDKNKCYFSSSVQEFQQKFSGKHVNRRVRKGSTGTVAGVEATEYLFENIEKGKRRVTEEYWVTSDSTIPTQFIEVMLRITDLPPRFGVPLKVYTIKADGTKVLALDTLSCHRVAIPDSVFQSPSGYRAVSSPLTLVLEK